MRQKSAEEIMELALPFIEKAGYAKPPLSNRESKRLKKIVDTVKERELLS